MYPENPVGACNTAPTPKQSMMDCMIATEEEILQRIGIAKERLYRHISKQQGDFPVSDERSDKIVEPSGNLGRMDMIQRQERLYLSEIETMLGVLEGIA